MILTVFNTKGGVGKSTLAVCLADVLSQSGATCLVDLDQQGTITELSELESFPLTVEKVNSVQELSELNEAATVVDCPPYLTEQTLELLNLSDFVLVPIKPGFADYFALKKTLTYVYQAARPAGVVLNMVKSGNKVTAQIQELIGEAEIPLLQTTIGDRVAYTRALVTGTVYESDAKAAGEINRLIIEIYQRITG